MNNQMYNQILNLSKIVSAAPIPSIAIVVAVIVCIVAIYWIFRPRKFVWHTNGGKCWAVITGAGAGIGYQFALQLALKGYNLMLISQFEAELAEAVKKIEEEVTKRQKKTTKKTGTNNNTNFGDEIDDMSDVEKGEQNKCAIEIRTLAVDFSRTDIYERIRAFIEPTKQDIFVLVNNVGMMRRVHDYFIGGHDDGDRDDDFEDLERTNAAMINVNMVAMTRMCEMILPSMIAKRRGLLINVSSFASKAQIPLLSTYCATKAYVSRLSECIAKEYKSKGIVVVTLHPVAVSTAMTHPLQPNLIIPNSEQYVRSALSEIKYQRSFQSTGYWPHSWLFRLFRPFGLLGLDALLVSIFVWTLKKQREIMLGNIDKIEQLIALPNAIKEPQEAKTDKNPTNWQLLRSSVN